MGLSNCERCHKNFRSSKDKEKMCAMCTIVKLPMPENVAQVEEEFRQISCK